MRPRTLIIRPIDCRGLTRSLSHRSLAIASREEGRSLREHRRARAGGGGGDGGAAASAPHVSSLPPDLTRAHARGRRATPDAGRAAPRAAQAVSGQAPHTHSNLLRGGCVTRAATPDSMCPRVPCPRTPQPPWLTETRDDVREEIPGRRRWRTHNQAGRNTSVATQPELAALRATCPARRRP